MLKFELFGRKQKQKNTRMQTLEGWKELPRRWCLKGQELNAAEIPKSLETAISLSLLLRTISVRF